MLKTRKPGSKGLKRMFITTAIVAALYLGVFAAFAFLAKRSGDPELDGFLNVLKCLGDGITKLPVFKYGDSSNIFYFALSCFLYGISVCCFIFLIGAIVIYIKKRRRVIWWALLLNFIDLGLYLIFASLSQKFWVSFKNDGDMLVRILSLSLIMLATAHFALSIISYFWAVIESYTNPRLQVNEETGEFIEEPDDREDLRQIIREELVRAQPLQVVFAGATPVQTMPPVFHDEPVEEPQEEVENEVEVAPEALEEPQEEVAQEAEPEHKVEFWDVAPEVFPHLENPEPLQNKEVFEEEPENEDLLVEEESGYGGKKKRLSFFDRMLRADLDTKVNYNEIKNELLSYGIKARMSKTGEVFRLHTRKYAKIFLVGKTLKVYLALDPEDYKDKPFPVEDVSYRPSCAEIPLLFKVRSGLSVRRCKELIKDTMERGGIIQKESDDKNWVSVLRSQNAEKAKRRKNKNIEA